MARFTVLTVVISTLAFSSLADHHEGHHGTKVGQFRNLHHGIAGTVYATGEHSLLVKDFEYDGAGPDAFFWVGTEGEPSSVGTILPYPFQGKFYEYEDTSAPILSGRFDKVDIKLTLPDDLKVTDLKWISVWCRAFKVNFGDLMFPDKLELEGAYPEAESEAESEGEPEGEAESEAESEPEGEAESEAEAEGDYKHNKDKDGLPPPLVSPSNAHDPNHRHHGDDPDAESQAESESESEPEAEKTGKGSAGNLQSSIFVSIIMAIMVSRW